MSDPTRVQSDHDLVDLGPEIGKVTVAEVRAALRLDGLPARVR